MNAILGVPPAHAITLQSIIRGAPRRAAMAAWAIAALRGIREPAALCLRVVDAAEASALNTRYRGRDYAPNVLSFPASGLPPLPHRLLGDIVLCAPVINAEAKAQLKMKEAHWAHMVVHGVLHLLGLDHATPDEARRMERREISILKELGYPNPYQTVEK
jgi:probable rRNA maturation factor